MSMSSKVITKSGSNSLLGANADSGRRDS